MISKDDPRELAGRRRRALAVVLLAAALGLVGGLLMAKRHWVLPFEALNLLFAVGWTAFAWITLNGPRPPHPLFMPLHLIMAILFVAAITPLPRVAFLFTILLSFGTFIAFTAKQPRLTHFLLLTLGALLLWTRILVLVAG